MNFNMQNWNMNPNQSLSGNGNTFGMNPNQSMIGNAGNNMNFDIATPGATGNMSNGIFSQQSMFGGQGSTGWVNPAIGAATAGAQLWQGMQQMDLAKEQLAFQKDAFAKNWSNQVQLTNKAMYDRDVYRKGFSGEQVTQTEDEWSKEHGVK